MHGESFDTSLRARVEELRMLGVPAYEAHRRADTFRAYDERALRELRAVRADQITSVRQVRHHTDELERLLRSDADLLDPRDDAAWDSQGLRRAYGVEIR